MAKRPSGKSGNGPGPSASAGSSAPSNDIAALESALGYGFRDRLLIETALRHASAGGASNERLEFLGDRVLGLIIADMLEARRPAVSEGELANALNALVRAETCAAVARAIGLGPFLVLGAGEGAAGGRDKTAILADAIEAVIGALYRDGGVEPVRAFILRVWPTENEAPQPIRDAKTLLQEWAQGAAGGRRPAPAYTVVARSGPDHAPLFRVQVTVAGLAPAEAEGPSKREAEQAAARAMLSRIAGGA